MAELRETVIDGVRCFWVATERPTLAAMLVFRYGLADEPIAESGWQHLLEHLALNGRGGGAANVNGQITILETVFQFHGPPDDAAQFLQELTGWLADPDLTRLDAEAKVLRAEASMRGVAPAASALSMRYGAQGPGLAGYQEPGLGRARPEALAARAAQVFTQDNAVLVLDGPPPANLRLRLRPGTLLPYRSAVPCEDTLPAAYLSEGGIIVSGVVSRSSDMFLAHELLREAMTEQFREQDGIAYAPWVTYERVDADHAVIVGGSDIHPEAVGSVADKTLLLVNKLRRNLTEPEAFEKLRAARVQSTIDPYARVGIAVRAAHEVLQGRPPLTLEQMVDEIESVDLVAVKEQWEAFHASMLLGVPPGATWADQLPVLGFPTSTPTRSGKRFRSVNWPADPARLTLSDAGVEMSVKDEAHRIPLDQVVGVLSYDDGSRRVIGKDGYSLMIDPQAWRSGSAAVAQLDATVPEELQLPHPAVSRVNDLRKLGLVRRWGTPVLEMLRRRFRLLDPYLLAAAGIVVAAVAVLIGMVRTDSGGYVLPLIGAVVAVRQLVAASGRRARARGGRGP